MKAFGVIVAGFAAFAFCFVLMDESLLAQDAKDEKKTEEKKTEEKKTEEKKAVRLPDPIDVNRAKKKIGKVKDVKTEDPAEIVVVLVDAAKFGEYREWEAKHQKDILGTKDAKARLDKMKKFPGAKAMEYDKVYSGEELQVPINEMVRIRTAITPRVFDDAGKEKKMTSTQLSALKAPPLPGYKSELASLKLGQIVEIYVKPLPPTPKNTPAPTPVVKKGPIGADPKDVTPAGPTKTEAYMILIQQDPQ